MLTVDLNLQRFARKRLSSKSAAAVVLDVERGDILTLCSVPGYNPNDFNKGLSREGWEAIKEDIYDPLINKSISGLYAPGSIFKMLVGLAALKYKLISPEILFFALVTTPLVWENFTLGEEWAWPCEYETSPAAKL